MSKCAFVLLTSLCLAAWGCGSSSYADGSGGNPNAPTPSTPSAGTVTIDVVAIRGSQSFAPDPATVPAGQMVVWHNVDTITHRVTLNDRSVDTGDLGPGSFSTPMAIGTPGGYHCAIHPEMIGSVNR
jgi:plastocyanin